MNTPGERIRALEVTQADLIIDVVNHDKRLTAMEKYQNLLIGGTGSLTFVLGYMAKFIQTKLGIG